MISISSEQLQQKDCPIVGIGASAGGLQALFQLFEGMSSTSGMAFVVIQHLDANNDSALADILSKVTVMPVSEVRDNTVARPNHVYVITPGTELTVSHGTLTVVPLKSGLRKHTPIDSFLESLAFDKGSGALGVILSGTGVDGSRGFGEIKAGGGITFAQEPHSAEDSSMPNNAIATGMVDFVLAPDEIANRLSMIGKSQILLSPQAKVDDLFPNESEELILVIALLRKASGVNFAEYKQLTVKRRIMRRMVLLKIDKLEDYVAFLRQNIVELAALQQDLLINVTSFFREPKAFDALKKVAFPAIVATVPANEPIRLWVPGCSTGEEAYSLAIALHEFLDDHLVNRRFNIFATDVNEAVIDKARAGVYPKTIVAEVSPARLSRFFDEVDHGYQVSKTIRDICVFARQDIGQDPPISKVDLISCRNVMIYFGQSLHKRIFPTFHYALNPDGFLFLGASESIGVFADLFDLVDKKHRIYTKKSVVTPFAINFAASERAAVESGRSKYEHAIINGGLWHDVQKEADRIVLGKYAPPF